MTAIDVTAIPAFADNYIWLIRTTGNDCAVVDPGDAGPVLDSLRRTGLNLRYILLTHHHPDHVGGVQALREVFETTVFGPADRRIAHVDHVMHEGDHAHLPLLGLDFAVIEVPGHTATHIAYHGHDLLFCGDTLFSVGCGRLFEGTAEQMQVSLDKLAALPPQTQVYCAHEYTLGNCRFALAVEPGNPALQLRARQVEADRKAGNITIPSPLEEELAINPFLRSRQPSVIEAARQHDPAATGGASTLAAIRRWKDQF